MIHISITQHEEIQPLMLAARVGEAHVECSTACTTLANPEVNLFVTDKLDVEIFVSYRFHEIDEIKADREQFGERDGGSFLQKTASVELSLRVGLMTY